MTSTAYFCSHCRRPVVSRPTFVGDMPYHAECTESPYKVPLQYSPRPAAPGCMPAVPLTEQRVREIVREEISVGRAWTE